MKKYKLSLLLLIGMGIFRHAIAQETTIESYIQKYKELAIKEMVRTGVPAAIALAQGIVESGAGTTWLSVHANNQFGIKCKSNWNGETVSHNDDRKNECFRKYATPADSWRDHSNFLKGSTRYQFLFYLDPLDYKAWAYGLKEAGYATSNRYARQIIQTIQDYNLEQYSRQGLALAEKEKPEDEFATLLNKKIRQEQPPGSAAPPKPEQRPSPETQLYPDGTFKINKRKVTYLPKGTQLIAIAEAHDLPLRRLMRYNELHSEVLQKDMLVYLEKKRKKGDHSSHRVQKGESLHQIAQEEGIRLKWLLKRNHLSKRAVPRPGNLLVLKGYAAESPKAGRVRKTGGFFGWLSRLFSGSGKERSVSLTREPSAPEKSPSNESKRKVTFVYTVKPGDTLYGISKKYNVTIDQIRQQNHLEGDTIRTGQKLLIPEN